MQHIIGMITTGIILITQIIIITDLTGIPDIIIIITIIHGILTTIIHINTEQTRIPNFAATPVAEELPERAEVEVVVLL